MKHYLFALFLCGTLAFTGCGKSDEDLCESVSTKCGASGAAADAARKACVQQLDSKSCGSAARKAYECGDDSGECKDGQLQANSCLSEFAEYLECVQKNGDDAAQTDTPSAND